MSPPDDPPDRRTPDDEVVRALYRALLGREPDASGLAGHLAQLAARPGAGAARLVPTLDAFLGSDEFRRHRPPAPVAAPPVRGDVPVLGLGTHPAAAALLARAGLADGALPFDGLRCPLSLVRHALEDDLAALLDPAHHGAPPPTPAVPPTGWHRLYEEELGARNLFARADPTDPPTLAALVEAAARLRRRLVEARPRLFLVLADAGQVERGDFERLLGTLEHLAAPPFRLLALRVEEPGEGWQGFSPLAERGGHRLLAFRPAKPLGPDGFALMADELLVRAQVEAARLGPWGATGGRSAAALRSPVGA